MREAQRLEVSTPVLNTIYSMLKGLQLKTMENKGVWKAEWDKDNPYK